MKTLLELYNAAPAADTYYTSPGKVRDTVATVNAGDEGVNFFDRDSTYQDNFVERGFNDKVVVQATEDDTTKGNFTDKSLLFYAEHVDARAQPDKGIHFYNQRQKDTWYTEKRAAEYGITQTYKLG